MISQQIYRALGKNTSVKGAIQVDTGAPGTLFCTKATLEGNKLLKGLSMYKLFQYIDCLTVSTAVTEPGGSEKTKEENQQP